MNKEVWLPVVGYENDYMVSSNGLIKGLARTIIQTNGHPISLKENVLTNQLDRYGYHYVKISCKPKSKKIKTHIIVCKAFHSNPENKTQVNHINGVRTDNRAENLEWNTPSENCTHAFRVNKRSHPNKGKVGVWTGKHFSEEHKRKISESNKITKNAKTLRDL